MPYFKECKWQAKENHGRRQKKNLRFYRHVILSLNIICHLEITVFLELSTRKKVGLSV